MRRLVIPLTLLAVTLTNNAYSFGLPKIPSLGTGSSSSSDSQVSGDSVDKFIVVGAESSKMIDDARFNLALALSAKDERNKLKQQQEQIKKGLDAKDQKAIDDNKAFQASLDAQLKADLESDKAQQQMSSLSTDQLKFVAGSVVQLAYGVLLQKEQIPLGQNMITAISANPLLLAKAPAIKNSISTMTSNVVGAGSYMMKLPTLLKSANISVTLPTDSSSKPQIVSASEGSAVFN